MAETRDQLAERLAQVANELIIRVRDCQPAENGHWLKRQLPNPGDWFNLAFVLAAAVPDDATWAHLVAWTREEVEAGPDTEVCGTPAGARRHWRKGEAACRSCKDAENARNRVRRADRLSTR